MQRRTKKSAFILVWALVLPVFVVSQVSFWRDFSKSAKAADPIAPVVDEEKVDETQDSISDLQKKIDREEAAKKKLEANLNQITQAVSSTQTVINKTKAAIAETAENISRKQAEIDKLAEKMKLQKELLKVFMQEVYYVQSQPVLGMVLSNADFADFFGDAERLLTIEDKIRKVSNEIAQTKSQIAEDAQQLAEIKEEHEDLLGEKVQQKNELVADKIDVQEDIEDKEVIIGKLQKQLVELQGDLNALTGKSYNAADIREAVEDASRETGVPEGVLYGFLKMETNLGANTGKCTYTEVVKVSLANYKKYGSKYKASIELLYKRQGLFYDLMKKLGYDKNKKVSCSPSGYIGQGGAMGIPQFMSDVWQGYSARITSATGHKTPDPWNLTDGVMAMAIKLRSAGATSSSAAVIKKASINYLGTFHAPYYNGIVYWSKNYKLLFD